MAMHPLLLPVVNMPELIDLAGLSLRQKYSTEDDALNTFSVIVNIEENRCRMSSVCIPITAKSARVRAKE